MKLLLLRNHYTETETQGTLLINGQYFCHSLEDPIRFTPKIKNYTAIPSGLYKVIVTYSPKFKRDMPLILNVPNFKGVRMHGGNTHLNTSGCPLLAKYKGKGKIWGSMEKTLTRRLKACKSEIWIEIINTREL